MVFIQDYLRFIWQLSAAQIMGMWTNKVTILLQVVAGLLCLANSLFGFYSCYKEVKSLLVVHLAVSILMLTVMVMGGVMAYVFRWMLFIKCSLQVNVCVTVILYYLHILGTRLSWIWNLSWCLTCVSTLPTITMTPPLPQGSHWPGTGPSPCSTAVELRLCRSHKQWSNYEMTW